MDRNPEDRYKHGSFHDSPTRLTVHNRFRSDRFQQKTHVLSAAQNFHQSRSIKNQAVGEPRASGCRLPNEYDRLELPPADIERRDASLVGAPIDSVVDDCRHRDLVSDTRKTSISADKMGYENTARSMSQDPMLI